MYQLTLAEGLVDTFDNVCWQTHQRFNISDPVYPPYIRNVSKGLMYYTGAYLCFPVPMFPGTDVPRYRCSPVPMFPGFCTLIVVISINRLQILPTPWYDSRLGLCLGFRFRVLVRVRVRVRLELQTIFRLWLGCGLGLSLYG